MHRGALRAVFRFYLKVSPPVFYKMKFLVCKFHCGLIMRVIVVLLFLFATIGFGFSRGRYCSSCHIVLYIPLFLAYYWHMRSSSFLS